MPDGQVLIAGGAQDTTSGTRNLASAELYDPGTGQFGAIGSMTIARSKHTATLLTDGRVLIAGGVSNVGSSDGVASAEVYDPKTGTFGPTGSMTTARPSHAATLLQDGRVLIAGGTAVASAELYDPNTGSFTRTGSLKDTGACSAVLLQDGRVFVMQDPDGDPELYDPGSGTFLWSDKIALGWVDTTTLLQDGRVLIAGGLDYPGALAKAVLYQP